MFLLSFARIIKFSLQDIFRNVWLSIVTVTILILALFSINILLIVSVISQTAISAIKEKVDVSLHIKPDTEEDKIMALKADLSNLSQVKSVGYISQREALEFFRAKYKDNPEILEALRELGKNPLTPSLIIKPENTDNLEELTLALNKINNDIIESRNFTDHKLILTKINDITDKVKSVGILLSSIFVVIALSIVFYSVRLSIYTHKREIAIMRLVGASHSFIYLPFLFSSLIYSCVGLVVIIAIFYPFLSLLQPYLEAFFVGYDVNITSYFSSNFIRIFGLEFLGIALINIFASLIAVRKYAQV